MEIKFDADTAATIAASAIFDSMSEQARDTVIKQAVQHLLMPQDMPGSIYGQKKSPLQLAFEQALRSAAFDAVAERIKNDSEIEEYINSLLGPLIVGAIEEESVSWRDELSQHIGEALGRFLADSARKRRDL